LEKTRGEDGIDHEAEICQALQSKTDFGRKERAYWTVHARPHKNANTNKKVRGEGTKKTIMEKASAGEKGAVPRQQRRVPTYPSTCRNKGRAKIARTKLKMGGCKKSREGKKSAMFVLLTGTIFWNSKGGRRQKKKIGRVHPRGTEEHNIN